MKNMKLSYSHPLVKLGLTKDEVACYTLLNNKGSLTAIEIAKGINIVANSVYRLLDRLSEKGFVTELDTSPKTFQVIPPTVAIEAYAKLQTKQVTEFTLQGIKLLSSSEDSTPSTKIEVITSRKQMFSSYVDLAKNAKEEILIISIGEPVPDDIKLVNRDALERGANIKFIAHKYDKENQDLLKIWLRSGLEVKHYKDRGYHLMVFDGKHSVLSVSNPERPAERNGIIIYSEDLSHALRIYFYNIWEKSIDIK